MVADLEAQGLLVKVVPHSHNVGTHDRCGTTVEPMIKPQWFVRMDEMAKAAIDVLNKGELEFVPASFGKTYLHWLEISVTGVFLVSFGGDTESRLTTVMSAARWLLPVRCRKNVRNADALIFIRMRILWIPGSAPHCGRSLLWDGRTKRRKWNISIRQTCL